MKTTGSSLSQRNREILNADENQLDARHPVDHVCGKQSFLFIFSVVKGIEHTHAVAQLTAGPEVEDGHVGRLHDDKNENCNG